MRFCGFPNSKCISKKEKKKEKKGVGGGGGVLVNNLGHQNSKLPVSEEVAKSLTNITWGSFFFFFFMNPV